MFVGKSNFHCFSSLQKRHFNGFLSFYVPEKIQVVTHSGRGIRVCRNEKRLCMVGCVAWLLVMNNVVVYAYHIWLCVQK